MATVDRTSAPHSHAGWALLRQFWSTGHDAWKRYPDAIKKLGEAPNLFVRRLGQSLEASSIAPASQFAFEPPIHAAAADSTWEGMEADASAATDPRNARPAGGGFWRKVKDSVATAVGARRRPEPKTSSPAVNNPLEFPES
jgi:hypothetical protein